MVDRIHKYFQKLTPKQRQQILDKLEEIEQKGLKAADTKPIKNQKGVYRLRIGKLIRILFRFENQKIVIIDADNRDSIY